MKRTSFLGVSFKRSLHFTTSYGGEEIPLIHGKEQWLPFIGAAVNRYTTSKEVAAAWVQEGPEELLHVQAQERRLGGDTPRPR